MRPQADAWKINRRARVNYTYALIALLFHNYDIGILLKLVAGVPTISDYLGFLVYGSRLVCYGVRRKVSCRGVNYIRLFGFPCLWQAYLLKGTSYDSSHFFRDIPLERVRVCARKRERE